MIILEEPDSARAKSGWLSHCRLYFPAGIPSFKFPARLFHRLLSRKPEAVPYVASMLTFKSLWVRKSSRAN